MKEKIKKTITFIKRFSKEIFIALALAIIAAIAIEIISNRVRVRESVGSGLAI
jgi:hypothetical protein